MGQIPVIGAKILILLSIKIVQYKYIIKQYIIIVNIIILKSLLCTNDFTRQIGIESKIDNIIYKKSL